MPGAMAGTTIPSYLWATEQLKVISTSNDIAGVKVAESVNRRRNIPEMKQNQAAVKCSEKEEQYERI